jgi:hypothetical protein
MKMRAAELGVLFLFFALALGGGLIIGIVTTPGVWYATLDCSPTCAPKSLGQSQFWPVVFLHALTALLS